MSAALQTLAVILLPIAIPYVKRQFHSLQRYKNAIPRDFTGTERNRLRLVALTSLFHLTRVIKAIFTREQDNLYRLTGSRLAIPIHVLRTRAVERGYHVPDRLWTLLETPQVVLAYLRLGSEPLLHCKWCTIETPTTYIWYIVGPIALLYIAQLSILSLTSKHRQFCCMAMLAGFSLEMYARIGGLDFANARTKTATDVLYIDSYASLIRSSFFLWTLAVSSISTYLDAKFPMPKPTLDSIRMELVQAVEKIRVSNSMDRAIGESEVLRTHANNFWAGNGSATAALDGNEKLIEARASAAARFGNVSQETKVAQEFIQRILTGTHPVSRAA